MPKDTQATSLFFPLPVARHGRLVRDPLEARLPKGHGRLWTGPSVGADSAVRATRSFDHDTPHCQLRSPAKLWRVSHVSPSTNASSEQRKEPTRGLGVRMKVAVEVRPNRAERSPLRAVHPFRVPGLARSPLTLRWTLLSPSPDSAPGEALSMAAQRTRSGPAAGKRKRLASLAAEPARANSGEAARPSSARRGHFTRTLSSSPTDALFRISDLGNGARSGETTRPVASYIVSS
ncbi:hypothetical protein HPB47_003982 [Ixodes persulcatus]|uniref:Uncharacterized protein n=1 Tax=Ixodes persulcatus TaxID=34615 RepID=A0AC60PH07_IXOPE|nr:hypothetical protein HPB47_003982 [Ixodes persulcatus]